MSPVTMQYLLCLLVPAFAVVQAEHPIKGVMQIIQNLDQKAQKLGSEEADQFEEYKTFMQTEIKKLSQAIAGLDGQAADLKSALEALNAKKESLDEKQAATLELITKLAASDKEANAAWAETKANIEAALKDINATMGAVKSGLSSLKSAEANGQEGKVAETSGSKVNTGLLREEEKVVKSLVSQHASLLELVSSDEESLLLDLAMAAEGNNFSVPTRAPVVSHIGKVMDLLKKLLVSFDDKRAKTELEALEAKGAYELEQAQRDESMRLANGTKNTQAASLAEVGSKSKSTTGELARVQKDLETQSKTLKDTQIELKMRMEEFKQRVYMRKQEHQAFMDGIRILSDIAGIQAPSLAQAQTFPKMRSVQKKIRAINMLHEAAHRGHSQMLNHLTSELENGAIPIAEVGKKVEMTIKEQQWAITDSQQQDDKKKAWCELEVNKTTIEKDHKVDVMKEIADKIELTEADVAALEKAIDQKTDALADAKKDMHEEKMLREKSKQENKESLTDAKDGQEALQMALGHIRKFYDNAKTASEVAAFTQVSIEGKPATGWGSESGYTGVTQGTKGTPGQVLLQELGTALASYEKMEATTKAQEAKQQEEFETKMTDLKKIVAESETELELKEAEKSRLIEELKGLVDSRKLEDREKTTLENYLKEVTTECYNGSSTFDSRAAARKSELAGLNDSLVTIADAFNVTTGTSLLRSQAKRSSSAFLAPSN
eukprot:TRINITY_DN3250_c0_g1_i2.p1 TRINITY_DN3250_c0_g1~~TRINITY_DN3250_c0_g1_i2.p1  ORF type:complete len:720 (-),score=228.28 TRINITY_DN3250_c0_g1_i2:55-2214(-)